MSKPRWLNEDEDRAWRGLRRVDVSVLAAIRRDLQVESGLSDPDYEVLSAISEADGRRLRARDLAEQAGWSTSRLAHHLNRMQDRGLIRRTDSDRDGRGSDVSLTAQGLEAIEEAAPPHVASVRRHIFAHLNETQVRQLAEIAETLLTATGGARRPPSRTTGGPRRGQ